MSDTSEDANTLSKVQGQVEPEIQSPSNPHNAESESAQVPPQIMAWMAEFSQRIGPDAETTKILAETERHAEDNKLDAYKSNLDARDKQNQRDHEFRLEQLKRAAQERKVILYGSVLALVCGGIVSLQGNPSLGNPIMSAALTLLITMVTGKWKSGD